MTEPRFSHSMNSPLRWCIDEGIRGGGECLAWLRSGRTLIHLCFSFQNYYFDSMKHVVLNIFIPNLSYWNLDLIRLVILKYSWFNETPCFLIPQFVEILTPHTEKADWVENHFLIPRLILLLSGNKIKFISFWVKFSLLIIMFFSGFMCPIH